MVEVEATGAFQTNHYFYCIIGRYEYRSTLSSKAVGIGDARIVVQFNVKAFTKRE